MNCNTEKVLSLLQEKYSGKETPTIVQLAAETGLSRQTVSRIMKELTAAGEIDLRSGRVIVYEDVIGDALRQVIKALRPDWTIIEGK
jgi:DNA-binding transcriptional regulator YhcF (GntR family)